jgi:signal transduction histidine kinase
LSPRVVIELVQITREAVSNAMRHAGAERITVRLQRREDVEAGWVLEVVDDGKGWSEAPTAGVGFRSMRERAAELGGTLEIRSEPVGGTRVRVTLAGNPGHDAARSKE